MRHIMNSNSGGGEENRQEFGTQNGPDDLFAAVADFPPGGKNGEDASAENKAPSASSSPLPLSSLREMEEKHRNDEEELEEPDRENPPVSLAEAFASSSVSAGEDSAEGGGSSGTGDSSFQEASSSPFITAGNEENPASHKRRNASGDPGSEEQQEDAGRQPLIFSEDSPLPPRDPFPDDSPQVQVIEKENIPSGGIRQETPNAPAPARKVSLGENAFSEHYTLGNLLRDARTAAGYSIADAERFTRIRTDYLEAMEKDDMKRLPPPVYISAYIRSLCSLYNLDQNGIDLANEKLRHLASPSDVPGKLIQDMEQDCLVNAEEEKRVRNLLYMLVSGGVLILILLCWGVFAFFFSGRGGDTPGREAPPDSGMRSPVPLSGKEFRSDSLEELIAPQIPEMQVLEIRKNY